MSKFVVRRTTEEETHRPDRESTKNTPRWAKVFGIAAIAVSLLFLVMMLSNMSGIGSGLMLGNMSGMNSSPSQYIPLWVKAGGITALVVVLLVFMYLAI